MQNSRDVRALASFARVRDAFAAPIGAPPAYPPELQPVVGEIAGWDEYVRRGWSEFERLSVFRRSMLIGRAAGDAIRLQRTVRTRHIDEWLAGAAPAAVTAFDDWRDAFFARCDAIAALAVEGLVAAGLAMPEEGIVAMAVRNPARLAQLIGGRESVLATVSVHLATALLLIRERDWFGSFIARHLRRAGIPLSVGKANDAIQRLNVAAGETIITRRHIEPLLLAYDVLAERGVIGDAADRLVLHALRNGAHASGKPWKGLGRLTEFVSFSVVDPASPRFVQLFDAAVCAPIDYTHVPGREWIVRDYDVGKHLMQIDGKVDPGDRWAALQQGRGSLAARYLRAGQERTEFGRRYSRPLAAFLDSMVVAEGIDHQRQRKAFIPFFSQAAVLEHARFVEDTVAALLDHAEHVARRNNGEFDLRTDFAYRFPIRIICHVLGLPEADVARVQHWAEASVRAMDTEAGVGFATARAGQEAAAELRAYLEEKLALARAGKFEGRVINTVARDETLSEPERVANLGVVIFAGFETTTGLISKGFDALLRHPAQLTRMRRVLIPDVPVHVDGTIIPDIEWRWLAWANGQTGRNVDAARRERLRAVVERSPGATARFEAVRCQEAALDRLVEELLRWTAPGTIVPLTASKDIDVTLPSPMTIKGCPHAAGAAVRIKRGETVIVSVDELNRRCPVGAGDFDSGDPAVLDVTRVDNRWHLSFGLRHSCIGAFLAKENAKRAIEGILRRFPSLALAGDPVPQEMELFSGLATLPVRIR